MKRAFLFLLILGLTLSVACIRIEVHLPEQTGEPVPIAETTEEPTAEPTEEPTAEPTEEPTEEPTAEPTEEPTAEPTAEPTEEPTAEPTEEPTAEPALAGLPQMFNPYQNMEDGETEADMFTFYRIPKL